MFTRELRSSFDFCARLTQREAKNFYFALVSLPRAKRRALYAIYAWMRRLDDLADDSPTPEMASAGIGSWMKKTELAFSSVPWASSEQDLWPAFHDTVHRYDIPFEYFENIAQGALMDQRLVRFETFNELYSYCYRVASLVGLVCLRVFGLRDLSLRREAETRGEALGIALQLTNILRDVGEDAQHGRIYLPLEDLRRRGVSFEEVLAREPSQGLHEALKDLAARAHEHFEKASGLEALVSREARPTLNIMRAIYFELLRRIEARNYRVLENRTRVPSWKKLSLLIRYRLAP
jgi:phytoene synthase